MPAIISLHLAAICLAILRPVSVVLCPSLLSKNRLPGLSNAPYKLFKLIFLTNCRLSQNANLSPPSSRASMAFFCSILRSAYQRSSNPGIIPFFSYVNTVPLALIIQGCPLLNTISYISAPVASILSPLSKSICINSVVSLSITSSYSGVAKRPSHASGIVFALSSKSRVNVCRTCPTIVSVLILQLRIILGYRLFKSILPIHLCIPRLGSAT